MSAVKPSYSPSSTGFGFFAPTTIDPKRSFALYNDLGSIFSTPKSKSKCDQFSPSTKSPQYSLLKTARSVDNDSDSDSESDDDEDLVSPPPYSEFGVIRHNVHDAPYHHSTLISAPPSPTLWARVGSFALSLKFMRGTRL
jgi:hypothetical protein